VVRELNGLRKYCQCPEEKIGAAGCLAQHLEQDAKICTWPVTDEVRVCA
jgi:hypothetical protein